MDPVKCPMNSYLDFRGMENSSQMDQLLNGYVDKPILFDLQNSWLKGEQYAHIL